MGAQVVCPICQQAEQVEKVSTIYLVGIGLNRQASQDDDGKVLPFKLVNLSQADLRSLARRLKPPAASRRMPVRPLHPDLVLITFSLVAPVFLFGIYTSQRASLPLILVFLASAYGLYFWKRRAVVNRFEKRQAELQAAQQGIEKAIGRWMKLYYCADDDVVFEPDTSVSAPVEQLHSFISRPG